MILRRENKGCQTYTAWFIFFLLSLFYISTTTRHTLENRRFLEANSNEKFCGTIRETLCECAAPSSMESYIYNIACSCVFHICCVYVSVCISMCLHVYGCVICACLRVLRYSLSLSFSLIFSLIFSHFSLVSFRSFHFHALFIFTLFFSRPIALLSPHVHSHTFFPPAFLSLSVLLSDIPRALSSLDVLILRFAYFYGTEFDSEQGNHARSNENRNRFSFDPASWVGSR